MAMVAPVAWFSQIDARRITALKGTLIAAALLPLARLLWLAWQGGLGANPIERITRATGRWTLALLLGTLAVTPLRRWTGWNWLIKLRRTMGLLAFFYSALHFTTYVWLDQFFDWAAMVKDVIKRPFITVGFAAFVLMLPLAVTSNNAMVRMLGGRRWQWLHRTVYLIGVLAVLHFWWLVKKNIREPMLFAMILTILLAVRVGSLWRRKLSNRPGVT